MYEIPADSYVIEAAELSADESAMTGETDPIKKNILSFVSVLNFGGF